MFLTEEITHESPASHRCGERLRAAAHGNAKFKACGADGVRNFGEPGNL